ncbi:unnamed protein product [Adineta ricciae]|uniref:IF rod domain-containing protein n=1 Tax=Adineta ricciae TaxID=249248 RepID=A0A814I2E0_ADIRI|nr:unnamed protein product [Adineta ricciae]CAF1318244.1 unnamed protein product [Adineta ricciae]
MDEMVNNLNSYDKSRGIVPSNIFLGLLPLPYSLSTLKNSLPVSQPSTSSSSSSLGATCVPQTSTNSKSNNTYTSSRLHSPSFADSNQFENQSASMSASTYRNSSYTMTKPPLYTQAREKERFELSTLNDKFADYVEKVRYLEAQNKKIQMEANLLTEKEQENTQKIKLKFETEIAQLRQAAEQLFKDKNDTFSTAQTTHNTLLPLKQQLNQTFRERDSAKYDTEKVERQLSSIEGDIIMFKRRLAHQDNEQNQWKQLTGHIQRLLVQTGNEIHTESLGRASAEQKTKQLHAEIARLREQQQQKLKEVKQSALMAGSNTTNDRAHVFKSELSNAIRRVRQDFERENDTHRNELCTQFSQSYDSIIRQYPDLAYLFMNEREQERIRLEEDRVRLEIQRVRADINALKQKTAELKLHIREVQIKAELMTDENQRVEKLQQNQINQFKSQHEKTAQDYEDVISKQTSLEKEIETYRNLLEGTMKPVVDNITDEYNTMTANNAKVEERKDPTPPEQKFYSTTSRFSSRFQHEKPRDSNFYNTSQSLYSHIKPTETILSKPVAIPVTRILEETEIVTNVGDYGATSNDNEQHIVEIDETTGESSTAN